MQYLVVVIEKMWGEHVDFWCKLKSMFTFGVVLFTERSSLIIPLR